MRTEAATKRVGKPWSWSSTKVNGVTINYAVAKPANVVKGETRKVLLAFPPGGQTADLVDVGLAKYWAAEGTKRGWVVISPAAPTTGLFYSGSSQLIAPFLDRALAAVGVTPSEVALGGISNGGLSAFRAAVDRPTFYSAIATLPGAIPGTADDNTIASLKRMRVGLWVGGNDASWRTPSQHIYDTLAGLSSVKTDVHLRILPGQGHFLEGVTPTEVWDVIEGKQP